MSFPFLKFCAKSAASPEPTRRGFSLLELLVVIAIAASLMAILFPMFRNMRENFQRDGAVARMRMLFQQLTIANAGYTNIADRQKTTPVIPNAQFRGTAMIVEWDDAHGTYWVYCGLHNQGAIDTSGKSLASLSPAKFGYSILSAYEPASLGNAKIVGLRANKNNPSGLELVPDLTTPSVAADSFAICLAPQGAYTPPGQSICINRQQPPPLTPVPDGPWKYWDTAPYNSMANTGEAIPTALPMVVVYTDSKADPLKDASGKIPASVDPNELIRVTQGHLIFVSPQGGGAPVDF